MCDDLFSSGFFNSVLLQFAVKVAFPFSLQLKGHCAGVQGGGGGVERGRVAVILEQGAPLQMIQLLQSPWEDRFRVSPVELLRLLSCRRSRQRRSISCSLLTFDQLIHRWLWSSSPTRRFQRSGSQQRQRCAFLHARICLKRRIGGSDKSNRIYSNYPLRRGSFFCCITQTDTMIPLIMAAGPLGLQ